MAVELAQLIGAALTGAGSVWGVQFVRGRSNGHGNGTNGLGNRLSEVERRLFPVESLGTINGTELKHLSKSVDRLETKVDGLTADIGGLRADIARIS